MVLPRHFRAWLVLALSLAVPGSAQDAMEPREPDQVNLEPKGPAQVNLEPKGPVQVNLEPQELKQVVEGSQHMIRWQVNLPSVTRLTYKVKDEAVAEVTSAGEVLRGGPGDNFTYFGYFNVTALFIGYDQIDVTLYDGRDAVVGRGVLSVSVLLSYQSLSDLFTLLIGVLVSVMYVSMGSVIDLEVVRGIARRPIGPAVGMVCQYVFMPLLAFGIGLAAFPGRVLPRLGLFLMGCCPGGGASNMWTHLLGGSLDLSIMMTFASSVAAFAALPLWVLLLGPVIMADADFHLPFRDIAVLVVSLSVPCVAGILIQKFLPRLAKVLRLLVTPITVFNLVFLFTFGVYANRYIFGLFDARIIVAGLGLPTLGYVSGLAMASLLCLAARDRVAISIETGIQNATLAVFILKFTLEKPAGDLTVAYPAAAVIMTPAPLIVALIVHRVYLCQKGKSGEDELEMEAAAEGDKKAESAVDGSQGGGEGGIAPPEGGIDNPAADVREEGP